MADPEQAQGPSTDIQTPQQFPTATRIEDGVAYDITGKKLGTVSDSETAQPASKSKFDPNAPIQALDNAQPKVKFDPNAPIQALDQTDNKPKFNPNAPIQPEEGWFHQNIVAPLADAARRVKNVVLANEGPGWAPYDILTKFGVKADPGVDWNKKIPMPPAATDEEARAWIQEMSAKRSAEVNRDAPISLEVAKRHIDEGRAVNRMEQVRASQYSNGTEGETSLLSPERLLTPAEAEEHPILYGLGKMAGSLTTQENLMIMAGTQGLGFLGEAAQVAPKLGALGKLVAATPRLVSAYFAGQMALGTAYQVPGLVQAKKDYDAALQSGDQQRADQILWTAKEQAAEAAASAYMSYAAAYHAGTGHPDPVGKAVGDAIKETTRYGAQKSVEAFQNIPEVAKATVEGAKAIAGATVDKLGPMIGRTNDFNTAILRASKVTPKTYQAHKDKIENVSEDLQGILNKNPNIEDPKSLGDAINRHIQEQESQLQAKAEATKGSKESVVPDLEQRIRKSMDDFFADNAGKYGSPEDVEAAKEDVINRILQRGDQTGIGPNGKPTYGKRSPNLFEAENTRQGLNIDAAPQYNTNARPTTDAYKAGARIAADELRGAIDEHYDAKNVKGVKEWRQKEANLIDVRDSLYGAQKKAEDMGQGSVFSSLMKKIGVPSTVIAIALGHPISGAAVGAAVLGDQIRQNVSNPNVNVNRAADIAAKNPNANITAPEFGTPPPTPPAAPAAPAPVTPTPNAPPGAPGMSAPTMFGGQSSVSSGPSVNHKLYAALSSHYGKLVGSVPFDELENRFAGDIQAAADKGQPPTPEQMRLLDKVNSAKAEQRANLEKQQKVDAAKAQKEAQKQAADQQKAQEKAALEAETAAKEAEKEKQEKEAAGLNTNVAVPFDTEDELELPAHYTDKLGYTGPRLRAHELGHQIMVDEFGHGTGDVISHLHPKIDEGAAAEARWDKSAFQDENGKWDDAKLMQGLPDILAIFYGGPIAEEVVHGVPVEKNPGASGDISRIKSILKKFGFGPAEIGMMTKAAELKAREVLTTPGVKDIIQRYTSQRQAGLDEGLHLHPETIGQAVQEVRQARGGGNGPSNKESVAAGAGKSGGKDVTGGQGKVPNKNAEGARPAGKEGAGAGSGAGGSGGLKAEIKDKESPKITEIIPELANHPDVAQKIKDLGFEGALQKEWMRQQREGISKNATAPLLEAEPESERLRRTSAGTRENPQTIAEHADVFNKKGGRNPVSAESVPHSPEVANRIAQAFETMPHNPTDPAVQKSYDAAKKDIDDQWNYAQDKMGIKFEPWKRDGQPYANSKEMTADVKNNKHLYFFQGGEMPADHPLAAVDEKTGLSYNDKLRAVHDLFGHAAHDFQFGPKGEENAWNVHRQMFSPEAVPALTTETRGQNSWVNFGEHLKNAEGKIPAKGEQGFIPPANRPYAQNKAGLLPEEFHKPNEPEEGLKANIKVEPTQEEMENFFEKRDNIANQLIREYNKNVDKPDARQDWETVPAGRLKKIWNDYAKLGFVRDDVGMNLIASIVSENIHKIAVNNALTGHTEEEPGSFAERVTDEKHPEEHFYKNENFFDDEKGIARISDYGIKPLEEGELALTRAKTPEEKLQAVDSILNIVHQRSDLPSWFVEGGTKTLNELSARPSDELKTNIQAGPVSEKLVDKFGTTDDPHKAGFILNDGRMVPLSGEHNDMISTVTKGGPPISLKEMKENEKAGLTREGLIANENTIRTRVRNDRGGKEVVFSVPKAGVSEEQMLKMRQSVGKLRNGNVVMEIGDSNQDAAEHNVKKEFASPRDVDSMLREIGAHPEQSEDFLKANIKASPEWKKRIDETPWETDDKPWNSFATGYRELHLKDANGKEVGVLKYSGDEGDLYSRIRTSQLDPSHQNQGIAKEMYKSGIEDARNRGIKEFRSDTSVSDAARHVWEALAREGYPVHRAYTKNFNANGSGGVEYTIPLQGQKITDADFEPLNKQTDWAQNIDLEKQPAGGINPQNPEAPSKRYGFEILPEARKPLEANPTAQDFQNYAKEHGDKLGLHPDIKLGWDTTGEKPELNIGASTDDLNTAKTMAKKLDQRDLWDNQEGKTIPVGGEGKKIAFPEYPIEDRLNDLKTNIKSEPEDFAFGKNVEGSEDQQKGLISTRVPSSAKAAENPLTSDLKIGREALAAVPGMDKKMADLVREYPGMRIPENIKDPQKVLDRFEDHTKENLKALYNAVPEEKRQANMQWYDSANKMVSKLAEKFGKSTKQLAGVVAAMSPQKDWDQNVSLAERVNDIYHKQQDTVATPEMISKAAEIGSRPTGKVFADIGPKLEGKRLSDLTDKDEKAAWIRLYDEAHNPREFQSIDPATGEGRGTVRSGSGNPAKVAWGGLNEIGKAVSILEDGSRENISNNLGDAHKVRNFYNNILDPNNPAGHVTIDTHAVAAALQRMLSGKSTEVLHNFGAGGAPGSIINGVNGTYPLYADAYRAAARDLGVQPRQLQSVVWEQIRSMFPAEMKRIGAKGDMPGTHAKAIDDIWRQYEDRKITLDKAHELVRRYAGTAAEAMVANQKAGKMSAKDFLEAMGQGGLFALAGKK